MSFELQQGKLRIFLLSSTESQAFCNLIAAEVEAENLFSQALSTKLAYSNVPSYQSVKNFPSSNTRCPNHHHPIHTHTNTKTQTYSISSSCTRHLKLFYEFLFTIHQLYTTHQDRKNNIFQFRHVSLALTTSLVSFRRYMRKIFSMDLRAFRIHQNFRLSFSVSFLSTIKSHALKKRQLKYSAQQANDC